MAGCACPCEKKAKTIKKALTDTPAMPIIFLISMLLPIFYANPRPDLPKEIKTIFSDKTHGATQHFNPF
jgi:hypothetical protein